MGNIRHFRELDVYRLAMDAAMDDFALTKRFPVEEKYSLTDQVRWSSRSVCANIAEDWRKQRYPATFVSKLNDADAEAAETEVWLEMAIRRGYLDQDVAEKLDQQYEHILGKLVIMISNPNQWTLRSIKEESADYD